MMVIMAPPRRHNQPDSSLLLSTLIQDTLCGREKCQTLPLSGFCHLLELCFFILYEKETNLGVYG